MASAPWDPRVPGSTSQGDNQYTPYEPPASSGGSGGSTVSQDTNWRDITALVSAGWGSGVTFTGKALLRRVDKRVDMLLNNFTVANGNFYGWGTTFIPGFRPSQSLGLFHQEPGGATRTDGRATLAVFPNGDIYLAIEGMSASGTHTLSGSWFTDDTFPTTLPGTAVS